MDIILNFGFITYQVLFVVDKQDTQEKIYTIWAEYNDV